MPKKSAQKPVAQPEFSESEEESVTDNSESEEEEVVVEKKTKKKAAPKKTPVKKAPVKKTAAPPAEKKPRKKAEPKEEKEEKAPVEEKEKKPRREKKAPELKPGQRSFQIELSSISPPIDTSKLKKNDDLVQGRSPLQAAKKAFTRLLRKFSEEGVLEYSFVIVETTEGSKKASFPYEGQKKEREKPREIKKGESTYTIRFDHIVKAVKKPKSE